VKAVCPRGRAAVRPLATAVFKGSRGQEGWRHAMREPEGVLQCERQHRLCESRLGFDCGPQLRRRHCGWRSPYVGVSRCRLWCLGLRRLWPRCDRLQLDKRRCDWLRLNKHQRDRLRCR
jgi:hypothetical protein